MDTICPKQLATNLFCALYVFAETFEQTVMICLQNETRFIHSLISLISSHHSCSEYEKPKNFCSVSYIYFETAANISKIPEILNTPKTGNVHKFLQLSNEVCTF